MGFGFQHAAHDATWWPTPASLRRHRSRRRGGGAPTCGVYWNSSARDRYPGWGVCGPAILTLLRTHCSRQAATSSAADHQRDAPRREQRSNRRADLLAERALHTLAWQLPRPCGGRRCRSSRGRARVSHGARVRGSPAGGEGHCSTLRVGVSPAPGAGVAIQGVKAADQARREQRSTEPPESAADHRAPRRPRHHRRSTVPRRPGWETSSSLGGWCGMLSSSAEVVVRGPPERRRTGTHTLVLGDHRDGTRVEGSGSRFARTSRSDFTPSSLGRPAALRQRSL